MPQVVEVPISLGLEGKHYKLFGGSIVPAAGTTTTLLTGYGIGFEAKERLP